MMPRSTPQQILLPSMEGFQFAVAELESGCSVIEFLAWPSERRRRAVSVTDAKGLYTRLDNVYKVPKANDLYAKRLVESIKRAGSKTMWVNSGHGVPLDEPGAHHVLRALVAEGAGEPVLWPGLRAQAASGGQHRRRRRRGTPRREAALVKGTLRKRGCKI